MLSRIIKILFPEQCIGCGREKGYLCSECEEELDFRMIAEKGKMCDLDKLFFCFYYDQVLVRKLISTLKFKYIHDLVELLGGFLLMTYKKNRFDADVICPVPLHNKREKERGFNQSALLAQELCSRAPLLNYKDLLERIKFDKPQAKLNRKDRMRNLKGQFRIIRGQKIPSEIIIVDDVATTLSTLEECARTLKAAGAKKVTALVLARA